MKIETEKILEKNIKTCPDCGKEFLGIYVSSSRGDYPKYHSLDIEKYKLECGKCPKCREQCVFYNVLDLPSIASNRILKVYDDDIKIFVDYVQKFKKMPCSEEFGIFEWNNNNIKKDDLFNDNNIKDYVEDWLGGLEGQFNICYCWLNEWNKYELIDLLEFFKEE